MKCKGIAATLMMFAGLWMAPAAAEDAITVEAVDIEYGRYIAPGQDPLIYPREHKDLLNLRILTEVKHFFFLDAKIVSQTDTGQFRTVGLHGNLGFHLGRHLDLQYMHKSEHVLDAHPSMPGYALYDAIGVVIHLIPRK